MNKQTTIYVLFKEYPDTYGRGKSAPYVQDSDDYLRFPDAIMRDWTDIYQILDYFGYESTNKYYDDDNLNGLLYVAQQFPSFYPSVVDTILSEFGRIGLTSWKSTPTIKKDRFYLDKTDITNYMLGDMSQREMDRLLLFQKVKNDPQRTLKPTEKEYEPCVLLHKGAMNKNGTILVKTDRECDLKLQSVENITELHEWLSIHRYPYRHYSHNEKHGDIHHRAQKYKDRHGIKSAAQLLTTYSRTKSLLKKAIGENYEGDLWYYDDLNDSFIYFENQGNTPQHEYHAYHVHPGEKNYDKIDVAKLKVVQYIP